MGHKIEFQTVKMNSSTVAEVYGGNSITVLLHFKPSDYEP